MIINLPLHSSLNVSLYVLASALFFFLVLSVAIIAKIRQKKQQQQREDAIGAYYSNLSTDEIVSYLKNADMPKNEADLMNRFLGITRSLDDHRRTFTDFEKKVNEYIATQGTIDKTIMELNDKLESRISEYQEMMKKNLSAHEQTLRNETEKSKKEVTEKILNAQNRLDQFEKDIAYLRTVLNEHGTATDESSLVKDQEILSERLSTLNEHLNNQQQFFESKIDHLSEVERKVLNIEKDIHLFRDTMQDMQAYLKDQIAAIKRSGNLGGEQGNKEFNDLIQERMGNFFTERSNQLQKMEIQLDELKNTDTVKQNVLMRLQKEFSDRLTDINQRISDQKNTFTEQALRSENTKHQLLELEKAIQELKMHLQGKQNDFFNKQDIRLQTLEDRFLNIAVALDKKDPASNAKRLTEHIEQHEQQLNLLREEIDKIQHIVRIGSPAVDIGEQTGDLETQLKELKGMVYSLIDSLKDE